MNKQKAGAYEWAEYTVNCCSGCANNCLYCYARGMAVRFRQMTADEWPLERIRQKDVERRYRKVDGWVMFPSSHDITPGNVDACLTVLGRLLEAGNDVLVVSKPRANIIKRICETFALYREKILFRFTIGAMNNEILSFWEPNAPSYEERKMALVHALEAGYATSVSMEPMLDASHIMELIRDLEPFVTKSIWIGKMNHIRKNIKVDDERIAEAVRSIEQGQSDDRLLVIHHQLKGHPLIRFKEEIRRVIEQQAD